MGMLQESLCFHNWLQFRTHFLVRFQPHRSQNNPYDQIIPGKLKELFLLDANNMRDVYFTFKFSEAVISGMAMGVHIYGFMMKEEPLPHEMFFCGTYFAYTLVSIFGMLVLCLSFDVPLLIEAIITGVGAAFFFAGSIVSMYHAENDFHLMYLSDPEEADHKFFVICKVQSIVSLTAALTFMLHSTFALDALVVKPTASQLALLRVSTADRMASAPLELVLFCRPWLTWCKKGDSNSV